jgi:hypothetical protein
METGKVTAKVQTPAGMRVEITGSKDEVRELLSTLAGTKPPSPHLRRKKSPSKVGGGSDLKSVVLELVNEGFFTGTERTISEVVARVNERGFNIRGRKIGALARALTLACRDPNTRLQRRLLQKAERKGQEKWVFTTK